MMLTPADLRTYILSRGVAADLVIPATDTPTVASAAAALGVDARQIIKSLLFVVQGKPVLVIATGTAPVDRALLAGRFAVGKKQVKLADAGAVGEITGYPVGGVPPFGHRVTLPVLLDRAVREWDVVYGGGGDERTLLKIAPDELARVTGGEWVDLPGQSSLR